MFLVVQVMGLLQVIVYTAASKFECRSQSEPATENSQKPLIDEASGDAQKDPPSAEPASSQEDKNAGDKSSTSDGKRSMDICDIFLHLPQCDLRNLCSLLGREGYFLSSVFLSLNVLKVLCPLCSMLSSDP